MHMEGELMRDRSERPSELNLVLFFSNFCVVDDGAMTRLGASFMQLNFAIPVQFRGVFPQLLN